MRYIYRMKRVFTRFLSIISVKIVESENEIQLYRTSSELNVIEDKFHWLIMNRFPLNFSYSRLWGNIHRMEFIFVRFKNVIQILRIPFHLAAEKNVNLSSLKNVFLSRVSEPANRAITFPKTDVRWTLTPLLSRVDKNTWTQPMFPLRNGHRSAPQLC